MFVGLCHARTRRLGLAGFPILFAAGCDGGHSVLFPAGPAAQGIATLWWWMFWGGAAIFALMLALFLWLLLRPAAGQGIPARWWIVGGGLVFPLPVLAALTGAALWLGEGTLGGTAPTRIEAEARMWQWQFRYPDGSATTDVLHLPAGRDVEIVVTSPDVIHSFWIPRLGGKIDAIPGHANRIVLRADAPGEYGGVCAEYCGTGHVDMSFTAVAEADWGRE
ncbi:cytochrome B [Cereibacter sp. SYSU M97828]|nr:cytochrome B [Cereibacter flavus]